MVLFRFSVREISKRKGRAILTLIGIVIGVAAVVSLMLAVRSTRKAYAEMFRTANGRAALEVVAAGGQNVDARALAEIENAQIRGIKAVVPVIKQGGTVWLPHDKGQMDTSFLGIDPARDHFVRDYEIAEGQMLKADTDGALMEQQLASDQGIQVGDKLDIPTKLGRRDFEVVGLLRAKGIAGFRGSGTVFMPLALMQKEWRLPKQYTSLQIVLEDGADEAAVKQAIDQKMQAVVAEWNQTRPEGWPEYAPIHAQRPPDRSKQADETLIQSELGLKTVTTLTVLVAVFIILNTFMINVGERRRQMAIMRAIGATRWQLTRMILLEGLLMGAAGTLLGVVVGLFGAQSLTEVMGRVFRTSLPQLELTWEPFVWAVVLGLGATAVGVLWPAYKAGRLTPLEGMQNVAKEDQDRYPMWLRVLALLTIGGSLLLLAGSLWRWRWFPFDISAVASLGVMVGAVLLIPALLRPASNLVIRTFDWLLRVEGRLAQGQIVRRRTRSALTVGVLFVAIGTGIGVASTMLDNIGDVRDWYQRTVVGDFFIRAKMPNLATGHSAAIPDRMLAELETVPGIVRRDRITYLEREVMGQKPAMVVRDFTLSDDHANLDLTEGEPDDVRRRLAEGQVVISTVLAQRTGLKLGDLLRVETKDAKDQPFRICGVTNEYFAGGVTFYIHRAHALQHFDLAGVDAYLVKTDPARTVEVGQRLSALCKKYGLLLQSQAEVVAMIESTMGGVIASLWAILALAFLVAAFGITNTLTMNVLEQTRELAMLRIIAMTRRQVRWMILAQAFLMGVIGMTPGLVAGLAMAWLVNISTSRAFGHPIEFQVHWLMALTCLGGGLVVVLLAAYVPAERATHLELLGAVKVE